MSRTALLKAESQTHLDHALRIITADAGNLSERARGEAPVRVVVDRMIQHVPRLQAVLEPPGSANRERAEHGEVEVVSARTVELVTSGAAEPDAGWLGERGGVEPPAAVPDVSEHVEVADLVGGLRVARRIERRPAGRDGE